MEPTERVSLTYEIFHIHRMTMKTYFNHHSVRFKSYARELIFLCLSIRLTFIELFENVKLEGKYIYFGYKCDEHTNTITKGVFIDYLKFQYIYIRLIFAQMLNIAKQYLIRWKTIWWRIPTTSQVMFLFCPLFITFDITL